MPPKFDYKGIILSGRPVFFAEGLDYTEDVSRFKKRWFIATKRRGLKLATWTNFEPEGLILQAYLPTHKRPPRPKGLTFEVSKKTYPHLYCSANACTLKLTANELKNRQCAKHLNA